MISDPDMLPPPCYVRERSKEENFPAAGDFLFSAQEKAVKDVNLLDYKQCYETGVVRTKIFPCSLEACKLVS